MKLAPIVLFVYNRPEQTLKTLKALAENQLASASILYIYCDGPKNNANEKEIELIKSVRSIARNATGFGSVVIIEMETNCGLATSIISGVTEVINKHNRVIVLEDDIFTSKFFLQFMNDCLNKFEFDDKVFSIGACNYFAVGKEFPSSFSIPIPDCWGWATWSNRWRDFEKDSDKLYKSLQGRDMLEEFNLFGLYKFSEMLQKQFKGENNSWAIRWQALCYLQNKVAIYPNPSISQHMHSTSGTHAIALNVAPTLAQKQIDISNEPQKLLYAVFKAMLRGYSYGLVQHRFWRQILKLKYYKVVIFQRKKIISYLYKTS